MMNYETMFMIARTGAFISGIMLSSVSFIQIFHLIKAKKSEGVSILSLLFVISGFFFNIPYLLILELYMLVAFHAIQMVATLSVILLAKYFRRNKNTRSILTDSMNVSTFDLLPITQPPSLNEEFDEIFEIEEYQSDVAVEVLVTDMEDIDL